MQYQCHLEEEASTTACFQKCKKMVCLNIQAAFVLAKQDVFYFVFFFLPKGYLHLTKNGEYSQIQAAMALVMVLYTWAFFNLFACF